MNLALAIAGLGSPQPHQWEPAEHTAERPAHLPALANPRACPRPPAGGRVGAADAGRPGRRFRPAEALGERWRREQQETETRGGDGDG
jgi:hypothetical protein